MTDPGQTYHYRTGKKPRHECERPNPGRHVSEYWICNECHQVVKVGYDDFGQFRWRFVWPWESRRIRKTHTSQANRL